jgi:hypothetical protein
MTYRFCIVSLTDFNAGFYSHSPKQNVIPNEVSEMRDLAFCAEEKGKMPA